MRNKIGTMFLASAVALAFISGSYAMWSETLIINGTVHTGEFNIDWSIESYYDNEIEGKQFSSVTAIIDSATGVMTVHVEGAYPCITYTVAFNIHNTGTIAAHFMDFTVSPQSWKDAGVIMINPIPGYPPIADDPNEPGYQGVQLHPDQTWYGMLQFHFDNEDGFAENTDYTFTVSIVGYQYNETP